MSNEENRGSRRKNGRVRARRRKELEEDQEVDFKGFRGKWEKGVKQIILLLLFQLLSRRYRPPYVVPVKV